MLPSNSKITRVWALFFTYSTMCMWIIILMAFFIAFLKILFAANMTIYPCFPDRYTFYLERFQNIISGTSTSQIFDMNQNESMGYSSENIFVKFFLLTGIFTNFFHICHISNWEKCIVFENIFFTKALFLCALSIWWYHIQHENMRFLWLI